MKTKMMKGRGQKKKTQTKISKGIYKTSEGTYMARATKSKSSVRNYRLSATFKKLKDAKNFYNEFLA